METRAHFVLIGAFVLIAVASAFLFVLWLGQTQREYDEYDVVFRERVSGLSDGAAVRFNGIQKGEVTDLSLAPDDPSIVIARVRVDRDTPVKTDTRAELELVGFTGLAVIQFVGGAADKPLLKEVQRGVPRIEADSSGFAALIEGGNDIVASANRLLSDENTESVRRLLTNLAAISDEIVGEKENVSLIIKNSAEVSADLAAMSDRLKKITVDFEALVGDDAPKTLAEARVTIAEAKKLIEDLRIVVAENREPISAFTSEGLTQVGPAMTEARRLMHTLDQILGEIDRDPRGYLFGESTPRYEAGEQ